MSWHRLIGGPHDGEWCDVRREHGLFLPPIWTVAEWPIVRLNHEPMAEPSINRHTDYKQFPLHHGKHEVVTFYIERSMTPEQALLMLAEGYRTAPSPLTPDDVRRIVREEMERLRAKIGDKHD